jgi:hypothetical protein
MYIERSDDIFEELYNFKVIHGRAGIGHLIKNGFNHVPNISKDIHVVMITNIPYQNPLNQLYLDNLDKLNFTYITLDTPKFRCGIDLIKPLLDFIKTIDSKYVLYMDAGDTALINDITDPQELLDTYKCKVLFNAEDGYSFPDHPCVDKTYLEQYANYHNCSMWDYYGPAKAIADDINISNLHQKINSFPYRKSLNSGLFLGEREYLVEILTTMMEFMNDDPIQGYPYGEIENQKLWQYLQSVCKNGEIEIDYLNLYFLWTHDRKFDFPVDSWEHFNYFNKLK